MKKTTQKLLFLILVLMGTSLFAQVPNTTGLPGDDLIFYEDMYNGGNVTLQLGYTFTVVANTGGAPAVISTIPTDGAAGTLRYTRPAFSVPANEVVSNRSLRIQASTSTANSNQDIWVVVNSVDLSAYDTGSKFFTFSTQSTFREDGGTNIDTDTTILYSTNFSTGTNPTAVTWTPITSSPVGSSAAIGADGAWTTQSVDLSGITCGTKFAIAIRRQSSSNGPSGGEFSSTNNRNGTWLMSDITYTGTTPKVDVANGVFSALNTSATGQTNIFNTPTASISETNFTNTGTWSDIFTATTSVPRLAQTLMPVGEGYKFKVANIYNPIAVTEVRYILANATSNQGSSGIESKWKVQGSNNDSTWDDLSASIGMFSTNSGAGTAYPITLTTSQPYRYYRFVLAEAWTPISNFTALHQLDFTIDSTLSTKSNTLSDGLSIYPNPTNSILNITNLNATIAVKNISLINVLGKTVYSNASGKAIDVSGFSKGLYILKIESQNGGVTTKKVMVK